MSTVARYPYCNPEIWGGLECTINRVGDDFRDQLQESGHYDRPGDLEKIAETGISKIRYPVLWENHQQDRRKKIDWSWTEKQLLTIRRLGMEPIAGLMHHGSGPRFTNLLDPAFPDKLASYARKVAEQFPWINYYTPINEPLTTARFSGLYGFWYPHHKNAESFVRMMLNQARGTVLAMKAIREVNPDAQLLQTEDLSKIHSTGLLEYQAKFENERRWLSYDLLCGKMVPGHSMYEYLLAIGIKAEDLDFFSEHPCPPDIMGFNYYVTSERYLDDDLSAYAPSIHGGNGRHYYADTEAVRVQPLEGVGKLLSEAWERYQLPLAITECHLSCTREEQLRWFRETWDTCCELCREGIQIRGVTAWSMLGAYDWDTLLVQKNKAYEPGVFDVQNGLLRPTALAKLVKAIATEERFDHPVLSMPGWWHSLHLKKSIMHSMHSTAPLLIIGRNGTLGHAFARICEKRSIHAIALSRKDLDISRQDDIRKVIDFYKPWAIINASGYVRVDEAELNSDECFAVNATGPGLLASTCRELGIRFMSFSSDLVFDGNKNAPYHETDQVNPLNVYGASKVNGEKMIHAADPSALIIRTSAFFGPWDRYNFVYTVLSNIEKNEILTAPSDVMVSPTYVPDLAETSLDLFIDEETGIWHLTNEGMLTWSDFGQTVAERGGYEKKMVLSRPLIEMDWKAKRPLYSVLRSEKGVKLPALENALVRYFEHREV